MGARSQRARKRGWPANRGKWLGRRGAGARLGSTRIGQGGRARPSLGRGQWPTREQRSAVAPRLSPKFEATSKFSSELICRVRASSSRISRGEATLKEITRFASVAPPPPPPPPTRQSTLLYPPAPAQPRTRFQFFLFFPRSLFPTYVLSFFFFFFLRATPPPHPPPPRSRLCEAWRVASNASCRSDGRSPLGAPVPPARRRTPYLSTRNLFGFMNPGESAGARYSAKSLPIRRSLVPAPSALPASNSIFSPPRRAAPRRSDAVKLYEVRTCIS